MSIRQKATISLYPADIAAIEKFKKRLENEALLLVPSTSEVMRLAIHHLQNAKHSELQNLVATVPERRVGKPKR